MARLLWKGVGKGSIILFPPNTDIMNTQLMPTMQEYPFLGVGRAAGSKQGHSISNSTATVTECDTMHTRTVHKSRLAY